MTTHILCWVVYVCFSLCCVQVCVCVLAQPVWSKERKVLPVHLQHFIRLKICYKEEQTHRWLNKNTPICTLHTCTNTHANIYIYTRQDFLVLFRAGWAELQQLPSNPPQTRDVLTVSHYFAVSTPWIVDNQGQIYAEQIHTASFIQFALAICW